MNMIKPILASGAEPIVWIILAIGWVVVQALIKNSRKGKPGPGPADGSPATGLDDFLQQLSGRASQEAEPEPSEAQRPTPPMSADQVNALKVRLAASAIAGSDAKAQKDKKPKKVQTPAPQLHREGMDYDASKRKKAQRRKWIAAMNRPEDWRRAMVLREVMGPPKAMRETEASTPGMGG